MHTSVSVLKWKVFPRRSFDLHRLDGEKFSKDNLHLNSLLKNVNHLQGKTPLAFLQCTNLSIDDRDATESHGQLEILLETSRVLLLKAI